MSTNNASKIIVVSLLLLTVACGHPQVPDSTAKARQGQPKAVKSGHTAAAQMDHDKVKTDSDSSQTTPAHTDHADHSSIRSQPVTQVATAGKQTTTLEPVKTDNQTNPADKQTIYVCGGDCSGFRHNGSYKPLSFSSSPLDSYHISGMYACNPLSPEEDRRQQQFAKRCEEHMAQVSRCPCGENLCSKDVRLEDTK